MRVVPYDPPSPLNPYNHNQQTRRGPHTTETGEVSLMEINQEEIKAHLMATNDQFRSLAEQHAQLKKQLETIESKPRLTLADEEEEHQIKKLKLRLKDQMNQMLVEYRTQPVH